MKLPMLFSDGSGRKSTSYNMMVITFGIITLWLVLWLILTPFSIAIPAFDVAIATGWFTPISVLYFSRRWTKDKNQSSEEESDDGRKE